jgi:predicted AAA+ superfamily ATPase
MKRDIEIKLKKWKSSSKRLPLIIQGARQVGKTYTLKKFGNEEYGNVAYFNFEENPALSELFEGNLDPDRIISILSLAAKVPIKPEKTLLFFDEIQESNRALNSLKYFAEQAPKYHIVAAGSLLGVKMSSPGSFPVGKVAFLYMYPMSFFEFLSALEQEDLRRTIEQKNDTKPIPEILHAKLTDFLKFYYIIGGMPASVQVYLDTGKGEDCRDVQRDILTSYALDFSKHVPGSYIPKVTAIWNSIPAQLAKENKKFFYKLVKKDAKSRSYEDALSWLEDSGLILKVRQISTVRMPLSFYSSNKIFKIYAIDVGLLGSLSDLHPNIILEGNRLFTEFLGAFTENYVAQELLARSGKLPYYWSSEGQAEIDFLIEGSKEIIPLEVKAGMSTKSKSLQVFAQKTGVSKLFRSSLRNFSKSGKIWNFPLYATAITLDFVDSNDY